VHSRPDFPGRTGAHVLVAQLAGDYPARSLPSPRVDSARPSGPELDVAEALELRDELLIACRQVLLRVGTREASALVAHIGLSCSRLSPFVRLGRTIRKHREGVLAARRLGLSNARAEALNNKIKVIVRRAYGFYSVRAARALILLACGPVTHTLPHDRLAM
jgi:hypothetical protein